MAHLSTVLRVEVCCILLFLLVLVAAVVVLVPRVVGS
jgi:hypothetical protein